MPWCEPCSKYYAPSAMQTDGTCPACGGQVDDPRERSSDSERTPWHFKVLVVSLIAYLTWRIVDLFV